MTTIDGDRLSIFLTIPKVEGDPLAWVTKFAFFGATDLRRQVIDLRPLGSNDPSQTALHGPLSRILGSLQEVQDTFGQRGPTPSRPLFTTDWQIVARALEAHLAEAWRILISGTYPNTFLLSLLSAMKDSARLTEDVGDGTNLPERLRLHMPVLRTQLDGFVSNEFGADKDNFPAWYTRIRLLLSNIQYGRMSRSSCTSALNEAIGLLEKYQRRWEEPMHPDSLGALIKKFTALHQAVVAGGVPGHRLLDTADDMNHPGYWTKQARSASRSA